MKKTLSILFALIIFCLPFGFSVVAKSELTVTVNNVSASKGTKIAVPVMLSSNPGIWGLVFDVKFDTSVLSVAEVRNNAEVFANGEELIGPDDFSKGFVRFTSGSNQLTSNNNKNGTLMIIYFNVLKNASLGKTALTLDIQSGSAIDYKSNEITVNGKNGSVTVEEKVTPSTIAPEHTGDVVASTANPQNAVANKTNKNTDNNKTDSNNSDNNEKTDNNGNELTSDVTQAADGNVITNKNNSAGSQEINSADKANNKDSNSSNTVYYIVFGILIALVVALIVVLFLKKKKANASPKTKEIDKNKE